MTNDVSVVIPAYNEQQGITKVLDDLVDLFDRLNMNCEIIVVDDGSEDKTSQLVQNYTRGNVVLVSYERNRGYGAALKTGIRRAQSENIVMIDADCSYPVDEIPKLLDKLAEADMVVGARTGEKVKVQSIRKPAKWFLTKLASTLSESDIPDLNSGLRGIKKQIVLKYFHILPNKFSFTTTLTLSMLADNYNIAYVPINYYAREGRSKVKPRDAVNFLLLILRTIVYFNPLKIIMPFTFFLGVLGFGKLVYDLFFIKDVGDSTIFLILFSFQLLVLALLADLIVRRT